MTEKLLTALLKYEVRHAAKTFPDTGNPRFPHWYKLTLYSDGSGRVEDTHEKRVLFTFINIIELEKKLNL